MDLAALILEADKLRADIYKKAQSYDLESQHEDWIAHKIERQAQAAENIYSELMNLKTDIDRYEHLRKKASRKMEKSTGQKRQSKSEGSEKLPHRCETVSHL